MKTPTGAALPLRSSDLGAHPPAHPRDAADPTLADLWGPTPGVDEAARLSTEHTLRACVALRPRPEGGAGLFARRAIAAGTSLVHRWHDDYCRGMSGWSVYTVAAIDALPEAHRALVHRYGLDEDFGAIWGPDEAAAVTTLDNFINHACAPNLGYDARGDVVTLRDLGPGEELTIDYGGFVVNYDEGFTCRCGAARCRGRVTREDWRGFITDEPWRLPPFVRRRRA
jgi:hypothetical protein